MASLFVIQGRDQGRRGSGHGRGRLASDRGGIKTLTAIGDCVAPASIATAVFEGHRYARELDEPERGDVPFLRERVGL